MDGSQKPDYAPWWVEKPNSAVVKFAIFRTHQQKKRTYCTHIPKKSFDIPIEPRWPVFVGFCWSKASCVSIVTQAALREMVAPGVRLKGKGRVGYAATETTSTRRYTLKDLKGIKGQWSICQTWAFAIVNSTTNRLMGCCRLSFWR